MHWGKRDTRCFLVGGVSDKKVIEEEKDAILGSRQDVSNRNVNRKKEQFEKVS